MVRRGSEQVVSLQRNKIGKRFPSKACLGTGEVIRKKFGGVRGWCVRMLRLVLVLAVKSSQGNHGCV